MSWLAIGLMVGKKGERRESAIKTAYKPGKGKEEGI